MAATVMFGRVALFQAPRCIGARNMATLKEIRLRLNSVKNIQKITKSMKMVSAAKFARAERDLRPARVYGVGATALYEKAEIEADHQKPKKLVVAVSSDRGLCGGIHSGIAKAIKATVAKESVPADTVFVLIGDKIRAILQRTLSKNILMHMSEVGRKPPLFADSAFVAQEILDCGYEFDAGLLHYNRFRNVASFKSSTKDILSLDALANSDNIHQYDDVDSEILRCYYEFTLANIIFYGMKENACSEQSSRMTSMESATKNAGEMIDKLTLSFNRTRQAIITNELSEIVSGAAAL